MQSVRTLLNLKWRRARKGLRILGGGGKLAGGCVSDPRPAVLEREVHQPVGNNFPVTSITVGCEKKRDPDAREDIADPLAGLRQRIVQRAS